ncbi:MAG: ABC transporter permease subunit [Candidatus Latescibacteria bacterium]|jgi:ABC-type transport system involved in multi-copper enzyme maturation permease subunit|nr:ABC transporter permease subunit [Candidatus Latescibacterota bacterium]
MKSVIERELIDNIKNFRFVLLFIFSTLLFFLNGMIYPEKYHNDLTYYSSYNNKFFGTPSLNYRVIPKPGPLSFIAEGGDKHRPREYWLRPSCSIRPIQHKRHDNEIPNIPEPDWAFIIKIIFSLYVILMGYNAISGEKEQGTLRLVLSNPFSRIKLIVIKYCAIMITVSVPLLAGIIVNLIIINLLQPDVFAAATVSSLLIMLVTTFAYLSVFALLSLMFSSIIHQSSLVLLALMVIWIGFNITPDLTGIISSRFAPVVSEMDIAGKYNDFDFTENYESFRQRVNQGEFSTEEELRNASKQFYIALQKNFNDQINDYRNSINQRIKLARNLSRISPTALFQYISESIAGTGFKREKNFLDDVTKYSIIYDTFLTEKFGELPAKFDFGGFGFTVDFNCKKVRISSPSSRGIKRGFDDTDVPVFQESKPSFTRTLHDALLDLSGLLLWNIVLALGAFIAFFRADVR